MILSNSSKTALKAVIFLGSLQESGRKVNIREIAEELTENEHTLAKILQTLVKQGVIMSSKGPNGGFFISEQQIKQSLYTVAESIDGKNLFGRCGLGLHHCSAKHPCPIHFEYEEARSKAEELFRRKKISDLCESVSLGKSYLNNL